MINPQFALAVLLFLGVVWTGVWAWVLLRSRQTVPYTEVAPKVAVLRRRLFWFILALMVVVFLVSMRLLPYRSVRAGVFGTPQLTVEVVAQQWSWTFSQNEIPRGVPVEFAVTSKDVNHGFGIYDPQGRLVTQVQAMPGYTNRLIFVFRQPGTYMVRCLELCGVPHHVMAAALTVQ
jgi:cytochrome c oxidase subunit 2